LAIESTTCTLLDSCYNLLVFKSYKMQEDFPDQLVVRSYFDKCKEIGIDVTSDLFLNWMVNEDIEHMIHAKSSSPSTDMDLEMYVREFLHSAISSENIEMLLTDPTQISTIDEDIKNILVEFYNSQYKSIKPVPYGLAISIDSIFPSNDVQRVISILKMETVKMFTRHLELVLRKSHFVTLHASIDLLHESFMGSIPKPTEAVKGFLRLYSFLRLNKIAPSANLDWGATNLKLRALFSLSGKEIAPLQLSRISEKFKDFDKALQHYEDSIINTSILAIFRWNESDDASF
jgi:hypothetical protein